MARATEALLWKGKRSYRTLFMPFAFVTNLLLIPLLSRLFSIWSTRYRVTNERIIITRGIVSRDVEEIELYRVRDIKSHQGIIQRLYGVGTVTVYTTDETSPTIYLGLIAAPLDVKDIVRQATNDARDRRRMIYGERLNTDADDAEGDVLMR